MNNYNKIATFATSTVLHKKSLDRELSKVTACIEKMLDKLDEEVNMFDANTINKLVTIISKLHLLRKNMPPVKNSTMPESDSKIIEQYFEQYAKKYTSNK